jgi:hypothetical protein
MSVADAILTPDVPEFSSDLLRGAAAIAEFLYGDRNHRRKIFYLCKRTNFPHFRIGAMICARKSSILRWIDDQEWTNTGRPPRRQSRK